MNVKRKVIADILLSGLVSIFFWYFVPSLGLALLPIITVLILTIVDLPVITIIVYISNRFGQSKMAKFDFASLTSMLATFFGQLISGLTIVSFEFEYPRIAKLLYSNLVLANIIFNLVFLIVGVSISLLLTLIAKLFLYKERRV
jgi:hypothetical protein